MKPRTQVEPVDSARAVGLRYVTDAQPGIKRIRSGAGFRYVTAAGRSLTDEATLRRIRALAIPPAWTDVWICPLENGHLQATGRDAKGRKQHRYHPLWRDVRDATKYDRMIAFARVLPRLRQRVTRDVKRTGLNREKVLATIVRLMDLAFIRVGNEEYAKANHSYGLTTMKDQHASVRGRHVTFSFRGKSGKYHEIRIEDRRLAKIVKNCQDIPGQDLFQYYNGDGKRCDVTSGDVNDYVREITGSDFTAKDFRTWAGTVLAAQALSGCPHFETQRQAKRNVTQAIAAVAEKLGNTPAVCRKCYVHPMVLNGYVEHKLPCIGAERVNGEAVVLNSARPATRLGEEERIVLRFLECCRKEEKQKARRLAPQIAKLPAAWRGRAKVA